MLLLAIADRTGFGQTARRAALEVEGVAAAGPLALALQLLSDISDILDRLGTGSAAKSMFTCAGSWKVN